MLRESRFIFVGILLGLTLYKSEAASWFRIFEMFHFQSFHMYGIIGLSVAIGAIWVQFAKRSHLHNVEGAEMSFSDKAKTWTRYIVGGFIFGCGWALAGVCPAPMFTLIGAGVTVFVIFLLAAMTGTFVYGLIRSKLPH